MSAVVRTGQVILCALFVLTGVIALSTLFVDDPFPTEAQVMVASFGLAYAAVSLIVTVGAIRVRTVWFSLWVLPLFLVSHVIALGTWVPDAVLAAVAIAALLLCRPSATLSAAREPMQAHDEKALS